MAADILAALRAASAGLLFPSERDAPLTPFLLEGAAPEFDAEAFLRLAGLPAGTPVERIDPAAFFEIVTSDQDWHDASERAEVRRWRALVALLSRSLAGLRVFRAGAVEVDACVVGRTAAGEWAGFTTRLIET
jgi:hypothetical protein